VLEYDGELAWLFDVAYLGEARRRGAARDRGGVAEKVRRKRERWLDQRRRYIS